MPENKDPKPVFELCTASVQAVELAAVHQLKAIELCTDLHCGGVTPSMGLVRFARERFFGELAILIRTRPGDFVYSPSEKRIMLDDVRKYVDLGVDAFVVGGLTAEGLIDEPFLEDIMTVSCGLNLCFHKAFDELTDQMKGLNTLIDFQWDRVLTSGGAANSSLGIPKIKKLNDLSENKICLMPGGGIRSDNILDILGATECTRIHALRKTDVASHSSKLNSMDLTDEEELVRVLKLIAPHDFQA
ncbi:MAG: copper homeostasis protein CutC [Saprospiraceae bacterium]|nr:copper homeostasis protein CutC [Candidatus Vicinibacter affinis]